MHGDVHRVDRTALGLIPFFHFGVEMHDGGICENTLQGVRLVSLAEFAPDGITRVRNPDATLAQRAAAVDRAASRIGERSYNLILNNCEHFANWCATGVAISHQVVEVVKTFLQMAFAALVSLLAVSLTRTVRVA